MSALSEQVLAESDTGCCVIRMGQCSCHTHIDEAARLIAIAVGQLLVAGDAEALLKFLKAIERGA